MEKKELIQADLATRKVDSEGISGHDRMEAAKSALEHRVAAAEHKQEKEAQADASGLSTVSNAVNAVASTLSSIPPMVIEAVKTGYNTVVGSGAAVVHKAVETTEQFQEGYWQRRSLDEGISAHERQIAAKKALEHHCVVTSRDAQLQKALDLSGLRTAGAALDSGFQTTKGAISPRLEAAAEMAREQLAQAREVATQSFQSARNSVGQTMGQGLEITQEKLAEGSQIVREKVNQAGEFVGDKFEATKEAVANSAQSVATSAQTSLAAVKAGTHELQADYYKRQAINEGLGATERIQAAKTALEQHEAAKQIRENAQA